LTSFLSASGVFFTVSFNFFSTVLATFFTIEGIVVGLVTLETPFFACVFPSVSLSAFFTFVFSTDAVGAFALIAFLEELFFSSVCFF